MLITFFIILTLASSISILLKKRKKRDITQKVSVIETLGQRETLHRCIDSLKERKYNEFTELVTNTFISVDEQFGADTSANEDSYYRYLSSRLSRNALNSEQKRANTCIVKIISLLRQSKAIEDILQIIEDTYFPHIETPPSDEIKEIDTDSEIIEATVDDIASHDELKLDIEVNEPEKLPEEIEQTKDKVATEDPATDNISETAIETPDIVDSDFAALEEMFISMGNSIDKAKYLPNLDYVKTFEAKKAEADILHAAHKYIAEKELIVSTIILFHEYDFPVSYWEKRLETLLVVIDKDDDKSQRLMSLVLSLSQRKHDIKMTPSKRKAIGEILNLLINK